MPVIIISSIVRGLGNVCGSATMWAMVSDTIDNGEKKEYHHIMNTRTPVEDGRNLLLKAVIDGRDVQFQWAYDGEAYRNIGPVFDLSKLSDEYSDYGEFTGTFVGITCGDRLLHRHTADFDYFCLKQ